MTDKSIPMHNLYVMMAYAFRTIQSEGHDRVASERFEHLHELLAEILVRGVATQVKRGLHRDYFSRHEELATVRVRIDINRTIATQPRTRGRLVCKFDEYESDTAHNRALKSVMVLRDGDIGARRKSALRRLLPHLEAVRLVSPTSIRWEALTFHRANASYRLLLGVCELIVRGLLPTKDPGTTELTSWVSDEYMPTLYERFLREYYIIHHAELFPRASIIVWGYDATNALGAAQLPQMRSDITLSRGQQTVIIDAK